MSSLVGVCCGPFHNGLVVDDKEFHLLDGPTNSKEIKKENITKSEDIECGLCVWEGGLVEDYLAQNETETRIENVIDKLCTTLPGKYGTLCKDVIERSYG